MEEWVEGICTKWKNEKERNLGKKTRVEEVEEQVKVGGGGRQQVEEWVEGICKLRKKEKKEHG